MKNYFKKSSRQTPGNRICTRTGFVTPYTHLTGREPFLHHVALLCIVFLVCNPVRIPALPAGEGAVYSCHGLMAALSVNTYVYLKSDFYLFGSARALQFAHLCARVGAFPRRALAGLESGALCHLVRQAALEKGNQRGRICP